MTQIEEEPAMMNPTILEEVQMEIPATTGKIICPVCGGELVLRTARRGANTGKQFYGCSSFPRCRYILNIAENLEKFLLGIGLEQNDIDHAKNPIIRNLLMKIVHINNPRMHQYFVDDLLTTSDPEIKLYKFNS